jgi:hypothetical protein
MMLKAAVVALLAAAPGALAALRFPTQPEMKVFRNAVIQELKLFKPSEWDKLAKDHVRR